MTQTRRNSHLIDIDRTPAHHKLQPGDWWQFIFDEPYYHPIGEGREATLRRAEIGDIIVWQFEDEQVRRQFRVIGLPNENVLECNYISLC